MILALTILHLLVCFFLILVVLLQTGKGADLAGAFGVGGSQTAFGARGAATLLSKLTTISAIVFMVTSFTLAIFANRQSGSVVTDEPASQTIPAPAIPAPPVESLPAGTEPPAGAESGTGSEQAPAPDAAVPPPATEGAAATDPNQQS
jgi:preprotein translocase subunit SecG